MRNPDRIPVVLGIIKNIWEKYPDLRLGQLMSILGADFSIEDYDLLEAGCPKFGFEVDRAFWKLPKYWIEPNAFKELIEDLNTGKFVVGREQ